MMSEDRKWNFDQERNFETINPMIYVESWFDNHPEPWNIDMHLFNFGNEEIYIYFADMVHNNFMIKISCNNARRASFLSKLFYKTTSQMGITQILKNKELFLFTDTRF